MEPTGPHAGCHCGCHDGRLSTPESDPGVCDLCGTSYAKGRLWNQEFPCCVHCGQPFEIEPETVVSTLVTLRAGNMKVTCGKCKKITKVEASITFDLEAEPPLT